MKPNVTDELAPHHFKTQLHIEQDEFFEFLWYKNTRSTVTIIENVEQLKKTKKMYKLWKGKLNVETSSRDKKQDQGKGRHENKHKNNKYGGMRQRPAP